MNLSTLAIYLQKQIDAELARGLDPKDAPETNMAVLSALTTLTILIKTIRKMEQDEKENQAAYDEIDRILDMIENGYIN